MKSVQREFEALRELVYSGLVYGSLVRDIDVFLVVDNNHKIEEIREELDRISRKLGKYIDADVKRLDDVEYRIEHNDYYLGTVLTTTQFHLFNQPYMENAKKYIFESEPSRESVLFNFAEGLMSLDFSFYALASFEFYQRLDWYNTRPPVTEYYKAVLNNLSTPLEIKQISDLTKFYLDGIIKNLGFSIGYLIAARIMQERGYVIDLDFLLSTPPESPEHRLFMENRRDIEKHREGTDLDISRVRNRLEKTKEFYEQFATKLNIV